MEKEDKKIEYSNYECRVNNDEPFKTNLNICFVIMPFGDLFDEYYELIFQPAIKRSGLEPKRADSIFLPGSIPKIILDLTKKAKVILADLTKRNSNVFYELGLAHALRKPTVLLSQNLEDVPIDLRSLKVLEYNTNRVRWGEDLEDRITKSLLAVRKTPFEAIAPALLDYTYGLKKSVLVSGRDEVRLDELLESIRHIFCCQSVTWTPLRVKNQDVYNIELVCNSRSFDENELNNKIALSGFTRVTEDFKDPIIHLPARDNNKKVPKE